MARGYLQLLKELLKEATEGSISTDTWYTFLPSLQETNGRWHEMARQVWGDLLALPIIATEVSGGGVERDKGISGRNLGLEEPNTAGGIVNVCHSLYVNW